MRLRPLRIVQGVAGMESARITKIRAPVLRIVQEIAVEMTCVMGPSRVLRALRIAENVREAVVIPTRLQAVPIQP